MVRLDGFYFVGSFVEFSRSFGKGAVNDRSRFAMLYTHG